MQANIPYIAYMYSTWRSFFAGRSHGTRYLRRI